ncbi:MAG: hypothetical protein ACIAQ0_10915 [Phycisphaerales bacterium JB058]
MNLARTISVVCIAIGLAGVSIALGFIYMDFVKREGAWVEMMYRNIELNSAERDQLLDAWRDPGRGWGAFAAGTLGVSMLGAGFAIGAFELPVFRRNTQDQNPK